MKVEDLIGTDLDFWAAKALGMTDVIIHHGHVKIPILNITERYPERGTGYKQYHPSRSWRYGGYLLQERRIATYPTHQEGDEVMWQAQIWGPYACYYASSPLVAAMRCIVHQKFGPQVPDNKE